MWSLHTQPIIVQKIVICAQVVYSDNHLWPAVEIWCLRWELKCATLSLQTEQVHLPSPAGSQPAPQKGEAITMKGKSHTMTIHIPTTLHAVKECKFPKITKSDWNRCGWGGKGEGVEMWRDKTNRVGPIKTLQDLCAHNANRLIPPAPCSYLPTLFRLRPPACKCNGSLLTQCLAQHNVGQEAEGVAFDEENSHTRAAVVEGHILNCNVLHGVLHPQVHENGFKKKKNEREVIMHSLPLKGVKQWPLIRTWPCTADSFLQDSVHRIACLTDLMWGCGSYRPE